MVTTKTIDRAVARPWAAVALLPALACSAADAANAGHTGDAVTVSSLSTAPPSRPPL